MSRQNHWLLGALMPPHKYQLPSPADVAREKRIKLEALALGLPGPGRKFKSTMEDNPEGRN